MRYRCCARLLAVSLLAGLLMAPASFAADDEVPIDPTAPEAVGLWDRLARKTATYQAMSSFNDFVFGVVFGGGVATGGMLAATSLMTEPVIHYFHETLWERAPPPVDEDEAMRRVPVKTATYAMANAGRVFAAGWLLTGNPVIAAGMVAFNAVGDSAVYAVNDAAWARFWPAGGPAPLVGSAGAP